MADRFGNAPEHESDTHPGTEEHRVPGCSGKLWSGIRSSDTNPAQFGKGKRTGGDDKDVSGEDEEPAKTPRDPSKEGGGPAGGFILKHQNTDDEEEKNQDRDSGDSGMKVETEFGPILIPRFALIGVPVEQRRSRAYLKAAKFFALANSFFTG